jgi:hypothetical protein
VPSPAGLGFNRVTAVQETKVDVFLWHIARIPYTSRKSCWTNHASTKKKCNARIVTNNKSIPAPTYTGMWHHYKLQSMKRTNFVFCPDDIERYIKGPRRKWVMLFFVDDQKPLIPPIWPVKIGTTSPSRRSLLLRTYVFNSHQRSASHRLEFSPTLLPRWICLESVFQNTPTSSLRQDLSKLVRRSSSAPSAKQRHMVASAEAMHGTILKLTMIPQLGFGCIITLQSKSKPQPPIYQVTVSSFPECNCAYFLDIISKFGRKQNSYINCKHMYYIFVKVSNLDAEVNLFIHTPTFSFNEVKLILEGGFLIQSTS